MSDNTPTQPLPATLAALLRYLIGIAGPFAVAKGWIDADNLPGIAALVTSFAFVAYGLFKTHQRQSALVNTPAPIGRSTIR